MPTTKSTSSFCTSFPTGRGVRGSERVKRRRQPCVCIPCTDFLTSERILLQCADLAETRGKQKQNNNKTKTKKQTCSLRTLLMNTCVEDIYLAFLEEQNIFHQWWPCTLDGTLKEANAFHQWWPCAFDRTLKEINVFHQWWPCTVDGTLKEANVFHQWWPCTANGTLRKQVSHQWRPCAADGSLKSKQQSN